MSTDRKSTIEKLSAVLEKLMGERLQQRRAVDDARAVLCEIPPAAFDREAAGNDVAKARVADLLSGGDSAEAVAEELERRRKAADKTFAAYEQRQAKARQQFEDASRLVKALTEQALEIDSAIRQELVALGVEQEEESARTLAESAAKFMSDYLTYKAMTWIRGVENRGDRGNLFDFQYEGDMTMAIPEAAQGQLPAGFYYGKGEAIVYKGYDFTRFVNDRVYEIMGGQSNGLYPQIAASLTADENPLGLLE